MNKIRKQRREITTLVHRCTVLASVLALASCVTASKYDEKLQVSSAAETRIAVSKPRTLLVVIRYPALFDRKAEGWLNARHREYAINLDPRPARTAENPSPFTSTLLKTNYYVMEFYQALRSRLPANTVALQPQRLNVGGGRIVPTVGYRLPPAVVYVDFLTYEHPNKFLTNDPNTFGAYISPIVTIRTRSQAAPKTRGALVGTEELRPKTHTKVGKRATGGLGYTFVDYLNDRGGQGETAKLNIVSKGPIKFGQYLELPQVTADLGSEATRRAAATRGGVRSGSMPSAKITKSLSNAVLQALTAVKHKRAVGRDLVEYIASFDRSLAKRYARNSLVRGDRAKMIAIYEFIALERAFLSEHDQHLFKTSYRGAFGDSIRQLLVGEMQHHSDFWQNQITSSLMILGTGLASGAATGNYMPSSLWDIYFQSETSSTALNTAFEKHFSGVREQQVEFSFTVANKSFRIKVTNLNDLRRECRTIYAEAFGG
ncbi:MAG: hypothetical protein GKS01_19495 [Alphaproteobacteria bacterium]|nr:hypothetical protein [Alphaproteobacteria bacterium]